MMMMMKGRIFCCMLIVPFFFISASRAQDKTGYFLGINPQNNALNPAYSYNRNMIIINPSSSASIANSSLTFHSMFNKGEGEQDTLLFWDFDNIEKKLRDHNNFYADAGMTLFFAGKVLQDRKYASLQVSRKYNIMFSYPESFINLRYGNADLVQNKPRPIDLNNYAIDGSIYDEFSFGLAKIYNERFSAGIHFKILQGKLAIKTIRFLASVVTSSDFSQSVLTTDAIIKLSAPVVKAKQDSSNLQVDMSELKDQTSWMYYSLKNIGAALDIGCIWNLTDKIRLSCSVNDLGFIHWGAKPQQLVSKGNYLFDGFYFSTGNVENFDAKNYFKAYTDTIQSVFSPKESDKSFSTWLYAKSYAGINYQYNSKFSFTGLLKSSFLRNYFLFEASLGTVYRPAYRVAISGTWSYSNYSLYNFGLGAVYTGKRYQIFAVTDNINAITILDVRGINLSIGVNWIIFQEAGKGDKQLNTYIR
jgi:hypothetical protein